MDNAYAAIQNGGLLPELQQRRIEFNSRYAELRRAGLSSNDLNVQTYALVLELYFALNREHNRVLRDYAEAFERYEALLQRIYWLLSHLIFYETISCLDSSRLTQMQQTLYFCSREARMTSIAPTLARTLRTGQLVHISMPELGSMYDGIFQVDRWNLDWAVGREARINFRAEQFWKVRLAAVGTAVNPPLPIGVFVPSEETPLMEVIDGFGITLPSQEGTGETTRIRDMSPALAKDESLSYP